MSLKYESSSEPLLISHGIPEPGVGGAAEHLGERGLRAGGGPRERPLRYGPGDVPPTI